MSPYVERPVKIGLGGYVIDDQVGEFKTDGRADFFSSACKHP